MLRKHPMKLQLSTDRDADSGELILTPNNALERSVKGLAVGAAGAWESLAPTAPVTGTATRSTRTLGVA